MRYDVIYPTTKFSPLWDRRVGSFSTLLAAREGRQVAGDIVVFAGTQLPVPSTDWLFDWEKALGAGAFAWRCAYSSSLHGEYWDFSKIAWNS